MIDAQKTINTRLHQSAPRQGFTLIELLVVIAIIAILAAILMPVLSKAENRAQQAACLSNEKQWTLACSLYVDDNNQTFPWPRYQVSQTSIQDKPQWSDVQHFYNMHTGNDVWFNALPNYVGAQPLWWWTDPTRLTAFTGSKTIFNCPRVLATGYDPADESSTSTQDVDASARPLFNYAMNSKPTANESPTTNIVLKAQMIKHPSYFVNFSDVRVRSDDLPFYPGTSSANYLDLATPHCYTTRFSARHGKGGNIAFSDGHAGYFKYSYVVNPNGDDPGDYDINWDCQGGTVN